MHIPDGFLDAKTIAVTTGLAATGAGAAWYNTTKRFPRERIPLLGLAAAFVFAAQMINFPVAGGTSGHLMGSVLVSVLLGPGAAIVVMSCVLVVQCFLFADGGVLALGANIFNMAVVGVVTGNLVYRFIAGIVRGTAGKGIAIAVASWISVMFAALCCAGELSWSGIVPWQTAFPAMAGIHAIIGIGEALITSLVLLAILRARPDLGQVLPSGTASSGYGTVIAYGLAVTFGLALFISPFASDWPDGLEHVASTLGFDIHALEQPVIPGLIPDYQVSGTGSAITGTIAGGIAGIVSVLVVMYLFSRLLRNRT